jgi:LEA14-like dessication related protein
MLKKTGRFLIYLLSVTVLAACLLYIFRRQIADYLIPEIKQLGAIQVNIKNDTCYVCPSLEFTNNTMFNLTLDSVAYDITILEQNYWDDQKALNLKLPAHGRDTLFSCIKIPYTEVIDDIRTESTKGDSTTFIMNIGISFSSFLGHHYITIHKRQRIKIPIPPEVEIVAITYTKVKLRHIEANARIKIINNGAVQLEIKKLQYRMIIFDQAELNGELINPVVVEPYETTFITMPIDIDVDHLGKTLVDILLNRDNCDYALTLNGLLEAEQPTRITFEVEVKTKGRMELKK